MVQLVGDKTCGAPDAAVAAGGAASARKHILRVLYRQLYNLLPGSALRRSETIWRARSSTA
ncbi:hypothetical protein M8494_23965 [Serratia ureilytica]